MKEKILSAMKKLIEFFLNPRLLLCVFIAWMITNGWSYVFVALGGIFSINWMTAVGAAYLGLLWLPFTPEKIITAFIAIGLLRLLFPNDTKTLAVMIEKRDALIAALKENREKRKAKRRAAKEI